MTYLEVFTLDRPSLEAVCRQFPECGKRMRKAARRMLIQRLVPNRPIKPTSPRPEASLSAQLRCHHSSSLSLMSLLRSAALNPDWSR